jgi:predicted lipid-binding transport protein (Tim44 family)
MPDFNQSPSEFAPSPASEPIPQFSTAEYAHIPGTERCRICNRFISGEYYRVNNQMACAICARQASEGQPSDSHSAFARGLLLGIGAALIGLAAYATFTIVTGWYLGYIALGVGWLVAKAIMKGSNGIGGRRYQITAVLLTYAAISLASIPILVSYGIKHKSARAHQSTQANPSTSPSEPAQNSQPSSPTPARKINWSAAVGQLALWGLASPFLQLRDPLHGAIGLFILFIGLRIAWQLTQARRLSVDGPYSAAAS